MPFSRGFMLMFLSNIFRYCQSRITFNQVRGLRLPQSPRHNERRLQSWLWVLTTTSHGIVFPFLLFLLFFLVSRQPTQPFSSPELGVDQGFCVVHSHPKDINLWDPSLSCTVYCGQSISPTLGGLSGLDFFFPLSFRRLLKQKPRFTGCGRCPQDERNLMFLVGLWFPVSLRFLS